MEKTFKEIQEGISKEILSKTPIVDGIINVEKYAIAKTRILWVLKEPYSHKNDWNYQGYLSIRDIEAKKGTKNETLKYEIFRRILYISYGLINNKEYANLPLAEEKEVYSIGEEIAYINIKKTGGTDKSDDKEIQKSYELNEGLLLKQIEEYKPHILIFGNTLKYFNTEKLKGIGWDLSKKNKQILDKKTHNTHFYPLSKKKLCINAYHPSYWSVTRDVYCSEIINAGLQWRELTK